jgi:DNA-binding NarL/FixJ family response regulator
MTLRVGLADDHPMYRYGLTAILDQAEGVDVVASVGDGPSLLAAVAEHDPDLVLTDLTMPGLDGVTVTRRLLGTRPELPILALTMHEDDEHVFAAVRAGARGYIVKGADGEEILAAIRTVASGGAVYGGSVARRIVSFYAGQQIDSPLERAFPDLTPRERDVLELLAIGCRNHEIARRLGISEKTVRNHVSQILLKLHVPDRTAAALEAQESLHKLASTTSPGARRRAPGLGLS